MPQLLPFFFINQLLWGYIILFSIIYITSKLILPRILSIYLSRIFIINL